MRLLTMKITALAVLATLAAGAAQAAPPLNLKVLQFARAQMGRQVGNGECWTLADQALDAAGAHRPGRNGYASYVFGREIGLRALQPGDVIQFENVHFEHHSPNGSWYSNDFPHHTVIVARVQGQRITLLHQNINGDRRVQTGTIDLADRQGGSMRYFRPQPR